MDLMTVAAIGMQNDLLRMNSISQNLANVLTPGYKREVSVNTAFGSHVEAATRAADGPAGVASVHTQTSVDPSAGTLRYTGNSLDVAIDGEGFFEVMTDRGIAYTRQGSLHADAGGRLATMQGHALMGVGGELSVSGVAVTIERNGDVRQGDRIVGQIKLVRFTNPGALTAAGNGLFSQGGAVIADVGAPAMVRAGYQENSNVNSAREMVRLTETVRHFESMQKVVQGYDEVLEKAIRKLGEF